MVSKGYLYHLVWINYSISENLTLGSVPVLNEFLEVVLEDLFGVPPERKVYFGVDLLPNYQPISVPLYGMALTDLKKLKEQ